MFDVAAERGVANASVADVVARSGVSRRTFYEEFADRDDCFLAAFEEGLALVAKRVLPASEAQARWCDRVRAGLVEFLAFCDERPTVSRLLVLESLSAGPRVLARREQVLSRLAGAVDMGRGESSSGESVPALTAESLVGGVLAVVCARIGQPEPLSGLANELMSMLVLPYLGASAARRELRRPLEPRSAVPGRDVHVGDPFKPAGMRLTYRTVRVLQAIAEHPGASNRQAGEAAGIGDQGQISKLLSRLARLGLLENAADRAGQGDANAWRLSEKGQMVHDAIAVTVLGEEEQ